MENKTNITEEAIRNVKSINDPVAIEIAKSTPEGVNEYYHTIGTLGGQAVKDKYAKLGNGRKDN